MKLASGAEALFSVKSFAAAMLSVYISMCMGLPRPFWALMTAYIVSAPFAGPTRSKGVYRACGTILGAVAVTFLVPRLANAPELLSLALALWIGTCLYFSLLDRTPRSYVLMLAGYTGGIIAFPALNEPGAIFDVALVRVEEIVVGIVCATVIHTLVLPQPFGPVLLARLDNVLRDAQHWIRDALNPSGDERTAGDRRKLAGDITELRMMSTHLPFDTSHLRWTRNAVNALQERLTQFVPIVSGIEDRLGALRELGAHEVSERWAALLTRVSALVENTEKSATGAQGEALHADIDALAPTPGHQLGWVDLIELNLATRLHRLVDMCVETRMLRLHIDAGVNGRLPDAVRHLIGVPPSALYQDRRMALLSALAAVVAVLACCAFCILTGWSAGAAAPMVAAVVCSFFAAQDDPMPFIKGFVTYTIYSLPVSALYLLGILPAIHNFETFVLACAPTFLLLGVWIARPSTFGRAMPFLFGICITLAMIDTHTADFVSFTNSMLSQIVGMGAAAVSNSILRRVGADWIARRMLRAGWSELARLGRGERRDALSVVSARMVDRVSLLTPRLARTGTYPDLQAVDVLRDLRVGLNMTILDDARIQLGRGAVALAPVMRLLGRHFSQRPRIEAKCESELLDALDNALRAIGAGTCDAAQREALAALTGMRRDLFPKAESYRPSSPVAV
jgi:uncharacterized membrane protein YccC